jgi:NAD(P)-dependent dehydrogenase (short-subunit alcohol dehydrogenase family)
VVRREVAQFGVKISMIEPGYTQTSLFHVEEKYKAIRRAFAKADPDVQAAYGKNYPEQAIAVFNAKLDRLSPHRYKIVDAIISALTSVYPRPRYVVGNDAKFLYVPMSFLSEWLVDWFLVSMEKRFAKEKGFVFQ